MAISFGQGAGVNPAVVNTTSAAPAKKEKAEKPKKNPMAPNIHTTKDGTPYFHTNTGKKIGTVLGTIAAVGITAFAAVKSRNLRCTAEIAQTSLAAPLAGLGFGTIGDWYYNHNEKRKAKQMKAYNA